jgi:hypothetical protein
MKMNRGVGASAAITPWDSCLSLLRGTMAVWSRRQSSRGQALSAPTIDGACACAHLASSWSGGDRQKRCGGVLKSIVFSPFLIPALRVLIVPLNCHPAAALIAVLLPFGTFAAKWSTR